MIKLGQFSKLLLILTGILFALYITGCAFLFFFQRWLIFSPSALESEITPAIYHLKYEEVWIPIVNSDLQIERIHGWWLPSTQSDMVFLHFHGAGANIGFNAKFAQALQKTGASVLLIDYRGYGKSEGRHPSEIQIYADAEAAWNYLTGTRCIPSKQILIFGHSLGGAIAIDLAAKHPEAGGLVVESSFSTLKDLISQKGLWIFPLDLLQNQNFRSVDKVPLLKIPVLFIHGTEDQQIPYSMSQLLYNAAPEPKQLVMLSGVGHDDLIKSDRYHQVIQDFRNKVNK